VERQRIVAREDSALDDSQFKTQKPAYSAISILINDVMPLTWRAWLR